MDPVRAKITSTLPGLAADQVELVIKRLLELGVDDVDDLREVQALELMPPGGPLKPVKARKLAKAFKLNNSVCYGLFLCCKSIAKNSVEAET